MTSQTKQAGFNIPELLIAIVAIIGLAGAGWFVYQHNRTQDTHAAPGSNTTSNQQTTTPTYLAIKEWGVKLPLSGNIKDAYYVAGVGSTGSDGVTNQVYLGLKSLDANGCTADGSNHGQDSALATLFRAQPNEVDPVTNKSIKQEYPNGVTMGSYFYAITGYSNTNISTCKAPQNSIESSDADFASAAKGLVSTNTSAN